MQSAPLFIEVSVSRHESERTHIGINVRDSRMANQEWIIQRHWQHCVHTTHDGDKKKHKKKQTQKTKKMFELSSFTLFPIRVLLYSDDVVFYFIVHRLYTYADLELYMYTDFELYTYTDLETTIIYNIIEFNIKFVIIFILISKWYHLFLFS